MHMTITDDFSALGLSEQMLTAVRAKGFETPTAIQKLTIPHLLTKTNDIIAQSQTGTGKTAAYGLPILQSLEPARGPVQAIILVPTRELAQTGKDGKIKAYIVDSFYCDICQKRHDRIKEIKVYLTRDAAEAALSERR